MRPAGQLYMLFYGFLIFFTCFFIPAKRTFIIIRMITMTAYNHCIRYDKIIVNHLLCQHTIIQKGHIYEYMF